MKSQMSSCPARQPNWVGEQISIATGQPLDVRFYGHRQGSEVSPLVLHFHGGAFVGGSLEAGSCVAGLLADAGATVMSLDYPLAPAYPFPAAVEAGYAALVWAFKARNRLAGHGAPVFLAGEEAGGNLAAAVALMARDRQGPALAGQILLSPMLDPCLATASLRNAKGGPVGCIWADGWHQYLARMENASHPYASPGTVLRLAGLPPTLLVTAEDDPLHDEALAYTARLRAAGLPAHDAVLPAPTGWPCSYLKPASQQAPWAPALRQLLGNFFSGEAFAHTASPSISPGSCASITS
jgi:acetyl esterase